MTEAAEWPLVGRAEELALLDDVIGVGPGCLVLAGAAGVGKSRLVADMLGPHGRPGAAAVPSVLVRATRSTATIPFGPFAAWAPAASATTGDRLGALQAISRALLDGVDRLVVAVDDAHLLDEGSAALVLHLVTQTPASLVATVRSGEPCTDAVTALWKEGLAQRIELQPLAEAEIIALVEQVLGGPLDVSARRRLWTLTEGVPLYVREVVRAAVDARVLTEVDGMWRWQGELGVAGRLADLVGDRLSRVPGEERDLLELLAFGEPLPVGVIDQLGRRGALVAGERRGLVVVDHSSERTGSGPTARLVHPLYTEVLRARVPSLTAQEHQRRLADAYVASGWHQRDQLRVASWWIASGRAPDEPDLFLAGAWRALGLAEWELAEQMAEAAERAGAGPRATLIRSTSLDMLGHWDEADALLADVAFDELDDDLKVEVAVARAGLVLLNRGELGPALDILSHAADQLDGASRAGVLAQSSYLAITAGQVELAIERAMTALAHAGDDTQVRVRALAVATLAWALQGQTELALSTAELTLPYIPEVVATDPSPVALNDVGILPIAYALALAMAGRTGEAAAVSEATMAAARSSDFPILYAMTAALDGRIALWRGRPAQARARGEEGLEIVRDLRAPFEWPAAVAAMGAGQMGDVTTARAALAWIDRAPRTPIGVYHIELGQGRAWLLAAQGELAAARDQLLAVADEASAGGARLFELLALLDVARLGGARQVAPRLVELAGCVDGAFAELAAALATALEADDGPALDRVAGRFEALGFELLAAETYAAASRAHGAVGRRGSGSTARGRARALATRCEGARTPALRDLDAAPALATLTSREREVVGLVARGLSNREVADRLYLSVRTVHTHLQRSYAKLGVNDREQLALLLPN